MDDLKGKTLGRYELLEDIGQGGMSTVYKARDLDKKKKVAVKVLTPYVAQEPKFRARFDREIKLLKDLEHENIVPVLNYGEEEGITYIVMPYYPGGTLQDRTDNDGLGLDEIGRFMVDVTAALEYAHEKGIVHRDIKPSNILLDEDGHAMLSDFGFAYVSETSHSLTGSVLIGTPAFMSPEQCSGEDVDACSDQYSLGAVLYQLTTGRLPYDGDTPMSVVIKHINDPLPRPRYLNPHLPDVLEAVILKAMAKDPEDRYQSIGEMNLAFAAELEESVDPETGLARPEYIGPAPETQIIVQDHLGLLTRKRVAAAVVLLALLALPLTAFALNGGLSGSNSAAAASSETPTPSEHLLATIDALSTANAEALGGSEEPGAVETAVAATVEAMGLFDEPEATETPTDVIQVTSTPTPSLTSVITRGAGSAEDDDDPPGPPPPTSTAVGPTNTPLPEPTDTSDATNPPPAEPTEPPPPPPPDPTREPKSCSDYPPKNPNYCPPTPP
ncbi:MAG: serine/threonine protein kinase [Anaerolineales bacterium]